MIEFRTLGGLDLHDAQGRELRAIFSAPKRAALLTYLAIATPRGFHRRDTLLALFWPEMDDEHARRALRQALYKMRRSVTDGAIVSPGDGQVGLDRDAFWCDAVAFEQLLDEGRLEEALALYRGELLEGFHLSGCLEFERWLEDERHRLKDRAAEAAWSLAQQAGNEGRTAQAARWGRRALAFSPTDEGVLQRLIELLDRGGDRAGAIREYEAFAQRLREDYEAEPAPETTALIASVRARVEAGGSAVRPAPAAQLLDEAKRVSLGEGRMGRSSWLTRRVAAVGVVAAALVITATSVAVFGPERGAALVPNRVVVAVLKNETGDATLDPVGKMAGDWITQGLQQAGIVEVIAWPTALQSSRYVQSEMEAGRVRDPVQALAEETGAGMVISGAYYREGETIRFQVQVTDAENGQLLGALDPVSGTVESPVEAIEELRERVLGFLALSFDERLAASARLQSQAPTLEAYRAYHDGMELYIKGEQADAIPHFYRAVALDSTFIVPLIYAAYCHSNFGNPARADSLLTVVNEHRERLPAYERYMADALRAGLHGDLLEAYGAYRSAAELAPGSKAVYNYAYQARRLNRPQEAVDALKELDPERGAMRGWVGYWEVMGDAYHMLGDHRQELETAGRARQQYPNQLTPLYNEVLALAALGRVEEVNERLDHAATLPKEWSDTPGMVMRDAAAELRAHGYPTAARDVLDRALRWFESRPSAVATTGGYRRELGFALYNAERWHEAGTVYEKLAEDFPDDFFFRGWLGLIAVRRGDRAAADSISASLAERTGPITPGGVRYTRARIAAALGERERAVALLQDAFAQGWEYSVWDHRSIDFESLRDYPPFQELLRPKG